MEPETITMSGKEVDRLTIIQQVESKQISQREAALQLNISSRQVRRVLAAYRSLGAKGVVSKRRGKPSNNRLSELVRHEAIKLIQSLYPDFKPTLAHEKLTEKHGLKISLESVRQLMLAHKLWKGKKRKKVTVHQTRERRSQYGELVQIDGSPHDWFEGRAPKCCLLVYVDDATSKLMQLHFEETETTKAYFEATKKYIKKHGRPLAYYSDKHTIFRVQIREAKSGSGDTQFGRALKDLGIELICAHSPQAKGRVERANGVLQDRLVKELRLNNISDIQSANDFLPQFMDDYNKRFAVDPANPTDAHKKVCPEAQLLDLILSEQHQRKLSKNLELSYKNITYQILLNSPGYTMRGANITVIEQQKKVTLIYKNKVLEYKTIDKNNRPTPVKDAKQINTKSRQKTKPSQDHPWRNYPACKPKQQSQSRAL